MSERSYLEEISIRNLGAIEQSSLTFGRGLNVLTGETGAGKTMILTALNLILGGKADSALVRHGADRMIATAQFSLPREHMQEFEEVGAEIDEGSPIITRTVSADGKSKAQCGGTAIPIGTLAQLSSKLIEIHGQAANTQIVKSSRQRELLDRFGGAEIAQLLEKYQEVLSQYATMKERINAMKTSSSKREAEVAELEEFFAAWQKLKPVRGEFSANLYEINRLSSVEELRIASDGALAALNDEDAGTLTSLASARRMLDGARTKDSKLNEIAEQVIEALYLIDEASRDLSTYSAGLEADPAKLNQLQERRAELSAFIKRYGGSGDPDEEMVLLAARAKGAKEAIADLRGGDERTAELEAELKAIKEDLLTVAKSLTDARLRAAGLLEKEVTQEIHALSMPHTTFYVEVQTPDYAGALKESDFSSTGCDEITMHIQGQKDGPKIALGKGASGGEMSRIMLALEVVIAKTHPVGTYIFDEVDAGVGGKAAIEVGKRLHKLAENAQVIVVTHLPQVAAWAGTHFMVKKSSDGSIVASGVTLLDEKARVEEIARMLAGLEESESAREHAAELLALRS